ncbi:MAG TPA: hypothetical protein VK988_08190 [Acidimicrobiales bacterium]|nr:hypothetical protein [Acidimicrobiales bacterium]
MTSAGTHEVRRTAVAPELRMSLLSGPAARNGGRDGDWDGITRHADQFIHVP